MSTCRDCKLWEIDRAKDKAGRVRKDWMAPCLWVSKEQYPNSVNKFNGRPSAGYTCATDGNLCPCFQKRGTT